MHIFVQRLAALATVLVTLTPAVAQRAGQVPDPISGDAVTGYAKRLSLSDGQRRALLEAHARYREAYAELREGPIAEYQKSSSDFMAWNATPDTVRETEDSLERVMTRIRGVDNGFFDALTSILTEAQAEKLAGLKLARERRRLLDLTPTIRYTVGAATVDLTKLADDLDLDAAVREAIAPILTQYDRDLTAAARRLRVAAGKEEVARAEEFAHMRDRQEAVLERFKHAGEADRDEDADAGADADKNADADAEADAEELQAEMEDVGRRYKDIYRDSQRRLAEVAVDMGEINRRTTRQLVAMLPHDAGRTLRRAYVAKAYRRLPRLPGPAARLIEEARADEALDEDARAALLEQQIAAEAATDVIVERMIDATDKYRMHGGWTWGRDEEDPNQIEYDESMKRLRERWNAANNESLAALGESLPSYADRATEAVVGFGGSNDKVSLVIVMVNDFPGMGTSLSMQGQRIPVPPGKLSGFFGEAESGPIGREDIDRYARVLSLTEDERALTDALYDEYRAQYEALVSPAAAMLATTRTGLWSVAGQKEVVMPNESDIDRAYDMQRRTVEARRGVDEQFFGDVKIAVLDEARHPRLERLRLGRARDRAVAGLDADARGFIATGGRLRSMGMGGFGGSSEADISLAKLVDGLEMPDAARAAVEPILASYAASAATRARARHDASRQFEAELERFVATSGNSGGMMPTTIDADSPYHRAKEKHGTVASNNRVALLSLNAETLEELRSALPPEAAEGLRRAYRTEVYPRIFRDSGSAEELIAGAYGLEDLTDTQRAEITDIAADYRQAYDTVAEKMVEIEKVTKDKGRPDFSGDPEEMRKELAAMQERRRVARQLRHDRSDLNERVRTRVRLALTETQRERIDEAMKKAKAEAEATAKDGK